jgi:hypothetical protein
VQIFKTKWLARFARREGVSDDSLCEAIERAERGLIDADLGGGLIKQRVARRGQGRSGGYRMLIVYRARDRALFLYGFAKSDQENITASELSSWRDMATDWLELEAATIEQSVADGRILEVYDDEGAPEPHDPSHS